MVEFPPMLLPQLAKCAKPGCTTFGTEKHHITYDPEVTVMLCQKHHEEITAINGVDARKYRRDLSNKHRWFLYYQWRDGKRKARRSHLTRAWESGMICLHCGSRSLKYSRDWGRAWNCKTCGSSNIGNRNERIASERTNNSETKVDS